MASRTAGGSLSSSRSGVPVGEGALVLGEKHPRKKKTFKALTTEVMHKVSVLQRLKWLTFQRDLERRVVSSSTEPSSLTTSMDVDAQANNSNLNNSNTNAGDEDASRTGSLDTSEASTRAKLLQVQQQQQQSALAGKRPRWWDSLCGIKASRSSDSSSSSPRALSRSSGMGESSGKLDSPFNSGRNACCSYTPAGVAKGNADADGVDANANANAKGVSKPEVMCRRHALRTMWKRYFSAFPRSLAEKKKGFVERAAIDEAFLRALLCDEVKLCQPDRLAHGPDEVMRVFREFDSVVSAASTSGGRSASPSSSEEHGERGDGEVAVQLVSTADDEDEDAAATQRQPFRKEKEKEEGKKDFPVRTEIVHLFVDEASSATFAEYVMEFPQSVLGGGMAAKNLRICELVEWDLAPYKKADAREGTQTGSWYAADLLTSAALPVIKRVMYFGKGIQVLPDRECVPLPMQGSRKVSDLDRPGNRLMRAVKEFVSALEAGDFHKVNDLLCPNFRMNALNGVKSRDTFMAWLVNGRWQMNCERMHQDLLIDGPSKTLCLHSKVRCEVSQEGEPNSAIVVNIVQWDLDVEKVITIREYGSAFNLVP
mmetsp:Transcript_2241/g.5206  ORF Transcript_2241/g.5206 Transcript_2241/m.5206 type:complete len:597 (-) Transcript_2241:237-2027(-)